MKYKLICLDLDGTLLDDKKQIPPSVKRSLQKAASLGIRIALVTARMPAGAELIEQELEIPCIKACCAGSYILWEDRCLHMQAIPVETMERIGREITQKHQIPLWIFHQKDWYVTGMDPYVEQEIRVIQYVPELTGLSDLSRRWKKEHTGPNKLLIAAGPALLKEIREEMAQMQLPGISAAYSSSSFLEISPLGADKGTALSNICNALGISEQETAAFGDQELDLPMIERAGMGIAMGNAIEVLKEKAELVTKTNNHSGVAYALEHYLLKAE